MADHFMLPERLDSSAASTLRECLEARTGSALVLDASGVEVIGALAYEVIIAAAKQWQADGQELSLRQPSPRFRMAAMTLGLDGDAPWRRMAEVAE